MGDTTINYEELGFGFHTFKKEICAELGEAFWETLTADIVLPDMDTECKCKCHNMYVFMERLKEMAPGETAEKILRRVRHGLHPSQVSQVREELLATGDLDAFLCKSKEDTMAYFVQLNKEKKDFYGQEITDEVLEFIRQNPAMLAPVRRGNKLLCMAFPYNMAEYLKAEDEVMKRYHACHCPFAKESILSDATVSPLLCHCSQGHVMNSMEALFDRELEGRPIRSVLNGDLRCEYEIDIPEDIMEKYVRSREKSIVAANYFRYYRAFSLSGIVDWHQGPVEWIMPKEGEKGPSLAFHINLNEQEWERELPALIEGIKAGRVPSRWIVTPDDLPGDLIERLESVGFQNLSAGGTEPGMLLYEHEFRSCLSLGDTMRIKRVRTREEMKIWVDVVNTALHGWEMIDAEHYYVWVEREDIRLYLCEMDGVAVSTAATIRTGDVASLEFVSTLEEYRRRGAAAAVSSRALEELFADGVRAVTLSGAEEALVLYKNLGFNECFENVIMMYGC